MQNKFGIFHLFLLLFIIWATLCIVQNCNLYGSLNEGFSMSNVRLVHHDLTSKYKCLANVPQNEIDDIKDQGYKIIEIDYEKNGMPAKLIIVYEEV